MEHKIVIIIIVTCFFMNLSCVCAEFNGTEEDMGVATEDIGEISLDEDVLMESESSQNIDSTESGKIKTVISSQNHTFNHPGIFKAVLKDEYGNPLEGANVSFLINGITYYRICDENGIANMNINLAFPKAYSVFYYYLGNDTYSSCSGNATINIVTYKLPSNIEGDDLTKYYGTAGSFNVFLTDNNNQPITNVNVSLTVDGLTYIKTTNNLGMATLDINLRAGTFLINYSFIGNNYYHNSNSSAKITVLKHLTYLYGENLTKFYGDPDYYSVLLLNDNEDPIVGAKVFITVNGITYEKITNSTGYAKLDINLYAGNYTVSAVFNGNEYYSSSEVFNNIQVKRHETYLISQNTVSYNGSQAIYEVGLFDDNDNPIVNEVIFITVGGIIYEKVTDERGIATLNINLLANNYTVNSTFKGSLYYLSSTKIHILEVFYSIVEFSDISTCIGINEPFSFSLTSRGAVCSNCDVIVSVNNKNYTVITNEFGVGQVFLNLTPGFWDVSLTSLDVNYKKLVVSGSIYVNYTRKSVDWVDVIESAVLLKDYINENYNLPSYFSVSGTMMNIYDFSYAMASAIVKINDGNTSDISIPFTYKVEPYVDSNSFTDASLDTYITMIRNIILFTELNNYLPINFSIYSSAIDFKTYTYGFSEILSYYSLTNKLPEHYQFNTDIYKSLNHVYDSTIVDLSQIGSGLNELNNDTDLNKYLVNDTYCKISQEILSIANTITEGYNTTLDKVNAIMEYSSSILYASYPGQFGVDWVLENNKANYVDTTNLIVALCRAINVPARFNAATVDFVSGNSYYHVWAQILVGDWWYIADGTASRNSLSVVNNWDPSSITNLTQGNLYTNLSVVYPFYELVPVNYSHIDYTFNDNVEIDFGYNVSYIDNKSAVIPSLNTKFIFENNIVEYGCEYFVVQLTDVNNIPLVNKKVKINIENQYYDFLTDFEGRIFLNLDLIPQTYEITLLFDGDDNHYSCSGSVDLNIVKSASYINPLKNEVNSGEKYYIELKDSVGNPIINKTVQLTINNETHQLTTDIMGDASFDILLNAGSYEIIGSFDGNDRYNSSFFSSVLNVGYKTKLVYDELLLHNGDEYSVKLVDYLGNPLINKEVFFKIINSNLNIVNNYSLITNSNGIITDFINVSNPGIYEVFCYFNGSNEYFESYGIFDIEVVPDDKKITVGIRTEAIPIIHKEGDYVKGQLIDAIGNPIKDVNLSIVVFDSSIVEYSVSTDMNGNFKFNHYTNQSKVRAIIKFYGNEQYSFLLFPVVLSFSYAPNFYYLMNITTKTGAIYEGSHLMVPYAREIGIYRNGELYKFSYGYSLSGTNRLNDNVFYFISLTDNSSIKIINSEEDIKTEGISLFGDGSVVSIKYWGYLENNTDYFNVIFDGKQYDGKYISNVSLFHNDLLVTSLYFSSEIFTADTREYLYERLGMYFSEFEVYNSVHTEFAAFNEKFMHLFGNDVTTSDFYEYLCYGNVDYHNILNNADWSPNLGYEAIESFLVTDEEITDENMSYYLSKYDDFEGSYKVAYECFLTTLGFRWLTDRLANEISENYYDLEWANIMKCLVSTNLGVEGRLFSSIDTIYFQGINGYEMHKAEQEYYFKSSILEQYIIGAHGLNSTCGVSEIMKNMLGDTGIYFYNESGDIIMESIDGSAKLIFDSSGSVGSYIWPSILNKNYTLNGGMSLGGFSFGDLSNIFNSLNKLLHPVTSIMTPIMVELDKSLSSNGIYNVVKDFAIDFMLSSAGSYLLYTGIGMALASPQLTVAVGIVAMGVGFGVILYNNGIFDQPLNSTRWLYSATDIAGGAVSKNIVKSISKFGLSGVYQTAFDMLVTTEETIVTGSINEIIHGVLN